ncbi:hypothetical protein J2T08_004935 [Neorhizobium galegae]|nr:hypothetical protein [Neorhizobium galegae]MDQ0136996.1 hypothetical protein [Neorhizobium galegae]
MPGLLAPSGETRISAWVVGGSAGRPYNSHVPRRHGHLGPQVAFAA